MGIAVIVVLVGVIIVAIAFFPSDGLTFNCDPNKSADLHLIDSGTCGSKLQYHIYDLGETKVLNRIEATIIVDTRDGWGGADEGPVSFWMTDSTDKTQFGDRFYTDYYLTYGELTDYNLNVSDKDIALRTGRYFVISSFSQMYVSSSEGSLYFEVNV